MTLDQALAFAIVIGMMALFAWGRFRYDLVAVLALLVAVAVGVVPPEQAFKGFGDDIVIIVGSALVVSAAVARSGVIERIVRKLGPYLTTVNRQVVALVGSVTLLSGFVKNIGGAGDADANRLPAGAPDRHLALVASDADVVRRVARGHRDPCRDFT
jgi:di/tricarboxylate transporter